MSIEETFLKLKSNLKSECDETVRILVKIVDNIVNSPKNPKVRTLQKSNSTVNNKILSIKGGLECLKLMGFQENSSSLYLPETEPLEKLKQIKEDLLKLKRNYIEEGTLPRKVDSISSNCDAYRENNDDLKKVKRFVLPSFQPKYKNSFLSRIDYHFHQALAYNDKACKLRAKKLIPLATLEEKAQNKIRCLQMSIKKENLKDPEISIQDMLLLELLSWFKEDFFSWVDSPICKSCGDKTDMSHMSEDSKDLVYTQRVEVYKCQSCQQLTKFPRYNDLNLLLETRRGRCGEWANVFTLMCIALGWDARFVVDELDHVWTEVYSVAQKRWVHCDPCENACDTPLMYECGWNKKLTYVIAYSPEEVQDVTWRYCSDHKEVCRRRKNCTEQQLIEALITLRSERQKRLTQTRRNYVTRRLINELIEMMVERKPQDDEKNGRISGSMEWRSARGEIRNENMYIWKIDKKNIINDKFTIQYSTVTDSYSFVRGDGKIFKVNGWNYGVFEFRNVYRKEEKDWKTVYLARTEGSTEATISWKFELAEDVDKVIQNVSLKFSLQTYESGIIDLRLDSDDVFLDFPNSDNNLVTKAFSGKRHFTINVSLKGGKGDVAWQHTQLFRQALDSQSFPFVLDVDLK